MRWVTVDKAVLARCVDLPAGSAAGDECDGDVVGGEVGGGECDGVVRGGDGIGARRSKGASSASSTSAITPLLATTNATDLVIGAINYPATATSTLTSGSFTTLSDFGPTGAYGRAAYLLTSAKGSYQATWMLSASSGATAAPSSP